MQRRRQLKDMPVWEKQPAARAGLIRSVRAEAEPEIDEELKDKIARTANLVSAATAAMTSAKRPEAESISAFIEKKREMFLLQMSLDTKREEIRKVRVCLALCGHHVGWVLACASIDRSIDQWDTRAHARLPWPACLHDQTAGT